MLRGSLYTFDALLKVTKTTVNTMFCSVFYLITLHIITSIFEYRFRSHPGYILLPDKIRTEIRRNTSYAKKLQLRVQKILEERFEESRHNDSHYRFLKHAQVNKQNDSLNHEGEPTYFPSPAVLPTALMMKVMRAHQLRKR